MNDTEIIARIKFLMHELNYRQIDFARKIDIDSSNLSKYLNGRLPVSSALINRIVVNLGVSKQWLEEGTDLPFAKQVTAPTVDATPSMNVGQGTPVYDVDATAGAMPRSMMFADDQIVGWVNLPDVGQGCRIIRVNGDSMKPVICNGDYIAIRELTSMQYIYWGQIYVVLLDDLRMVKYVRRHPDPDFVTLRSANKEYDDMDIPRNKIRELMLVQQILHLDTRI